MQNNLENLRRELIEMPNFNMYEAFKTAKCHNNNLISIDKDTLRMYLERNGEPCPISIVDLNSIMVRYDLDGDDQLNFKEFEMSLIPIDSIKELEEEQIIYES